MSLVSSKTCGTPTGGAGCSRSDRVNYSKTMATGEGMRSTVVQGGIFNIAKVNYSPETRQFMKELLRESRLTVLMQRRVQEAVERGLPLPVTDARALPRRPHPRVPAPAPSGPPLPPEMLYGAVAPRAARRPLHAIQSSGAYECERFVPQRPRDKAKEIDKLQNIMAYGHPESPAEQNIKRKQDIEELEPPEEKDIMDHLMEEIRDRLQFLEEMKELGEEKKYKQIIMTEISSKLHQMEKIDKEESLKLKNSIINEAKL